MQESADYSGKLYSFLKIKFIYIGIFTNLISFLLTFISLGSSVRDESMYSTSTQKQSFDSVTLPRLPSLTIMQTKNGHVQFDVTADAKVITTTPTTHQDINTGVSGTTTTAIGHIHNYQSLTIIKDLSHQLAGGGGKGVVGNPNDCEKVLNLMDTIGNSALERNNKIESASDDGINVMYNKIDDIKISFVNGNDARPKSKSKFSVILENMIFWRKGNTRNVGYYSPPPRDHTLNIDTTLTTIKNTTITTKSEENNVHTIDYAKEDKIDSESLDDGAISNSSMKNVDKYALEDELSAYMAEIRMREKR